MRSISHHIMPLVIINLGHGPTNTQTQTHTHTHKYTHRHTRTHTDTHTNTDDPLRNNFKKPGSH